MKTEMIPYPDLAIESRYGGIICGVDEAGRGPLAGPVVAAAVVLDRAAIPAGIHDSKKTNKKKRELLFDKIMQTAKVGIGHANVAEIDTFNILGATKIAMQRAVEALELGVDVALIDGNQPPALPCKVLTVVKGDSKSLSIAAASIIAKVTRDRMMKDLDARYPVYGFAQHAGYGTKAHMEAIDAHGVCPVHRSSFAPVRQALEKEAV